ncbi:serine hydrolase [Candidatus Micrarchaeota archaeon]|nr:serine hydrolase [Candidatus Micrarchaeota archaeon]
MDGSPRKTGLACSSTGYKATRVSCASTSTLRACRQASLSHSSCSPPTSIVEKIPEGGKTYRNRTTARNLNALLWQLHNGKLISPAYSSRMMRHLDGYSTSRLKALQSDFDLDMAGKTGFVSGLNGEAARISYKTAKGETKHYNFIVMIENTKMPGENGAAWGKRTSRAIRSIFKAVHKNMVKP